MSIGKKYTKEKTYGSRLLLFAVMLLGLMTMGACNSAPVIAAPAVGRLSGAMLLSSKAVTSAVNEALAQYEEYSKATPNDTEVGTSEE